MNLKSCLPFAAALVLSASALAGAQTSKPKAGGDAAPKQESVGRVEVVWEGREFRRGDRVRITSRAGTIKPDESGHRNELNADAGRTGTVISGEKRPATSYFKPDPDEPIQLLLVRWDRQTWTEVGNGKRVTLGPFESTIHADYLRVVRKPKAR